MEANAYLGDRLHGKLATMRVLVLAALLVGCGDNIKPTPATDILTALQALPDVADVTEQPTTTFGYRYFVIHFRQPVDHGDPASATFLQEVSLLHKDPAAPLVVWTSGYWDYYLDQTTEPTRLLGANQISIEHRYFGTSRPAPADWTKLTIDQMAADEHVIVSELRTIYTGAAIASGGSKGGMTAIFFRRFFPSDVDGTLPYVAPISFAELDPRYPPYILTLGPATCHQAIRDLAVEIIKNRRTAMETLAQAQAAARAYEYTRIKLGPAVESAIEGLEWSFWQYFGVASCTNVPAVTATDQAVFDFLDMISPISESDDDYVGKFEAYVYQAYAQLGYPDDGTDYLKPYYMYTDTDYAGALPTAQPAYDNAVAMHDVASYLATSGDRFVFIYGQWDPWTGGAFALGGATDSLELIEAQGTHDSHVTGLAASDEQAALAELAAWTGVTPHTSARSVRVAEPHVPSLIRTMGARRLRP
jgi:hypothetical protein